MYAFDDSLQTAWQALFQNTARLAPALNLPDHVLFTDSTEKTLDPETRLAHTCGYPLVTRFKGLLAPLCVPCFDVEGCEDGFYHSLFLVRDGDKAHKLADCKGYRAAMNHVESNSGMNVFRAAVAKIKSEHINQAFFESVYVSGSHLNSVRAIAQGEVDVAAVDAVTYHFILKFKPELCRGLRAIGRSDSTMGLPFVARINAPGLDNKSLSEALNQALEQTPQVFSALDLKRFKVVELQDYQSILALEQYAIKTGYPSLI